MPEQTPILIIVVLAVALLLIGYGLKFLQAVCTRIQHPLTQRTAAFLSKRMALFNKPIGQDSPLIRTLTAADGEAASPDRQEDRPVSRRQKLIHVSMLSLAVIPLGLCGLVWMDQYYFPYTISDVNVSPDGVRRR